MKSAKSGNGQKKDFQSLKDPKEFCEICHQEVKRIWGMCKSSKSRPSSQISDCARSRVVREAAKTPGTTLNELQASAGEKGECIQLLYCTARVLYQSKLFGKWQRERHC